MDLEALMENLGREGIDSVLIEGGSTIHWSALKAGLAQKVFTYTAPKLIGGAAAKTPVEGEGFPSPDAGVQLAVRDVRRLGEDILIESEVIRDVHGNRGRDRND